MTRTQGLQSAGIGFVALATHHCQARPSRNLRSMARDDDSMDFKAKRLEKAIVANFGELASARADAVASSRRPGEAFPRSQSMPYLEAAMDDLFLAGDPQSLYDDVSPRFKPDAGLSSAALGAVFGSTQQWMDAANRRVRSLRSATIMVAIAVEAYANEFVCDLVGNRVTDDEFDAIDRMRP